MLSPYQKNLLGLIGESILLLLFVTPVLFKIYWAIGRKITTLLGVKWPITLDNMGVGLALGVACLLLSLHHTFELLEYLET